MTTTTAAARVRDALGPAVARREALVPPETAALLRSALDVITGDAHALAGADAALDEVVGLFGLDDAAAGALAVAQLAEVHPSGHLLAGLLSGAAGAGRPTVALALELTGAHLGSVAARALVDPAGPLCRTGLLELAGDDPLPARTLRLPPRVAARLVGAVHPPEHLARLLVAPVPCDSPAAAAVAAALRAGEPLVWVHAPLGTAGTAEAVGACRTLDVAVLVADLERLPTAPDAPLDADLVRRTLRDLALEAGMTGSVLVVAGAHVAGPHVVELDRAVMPVVAVGRTAWDARWAATLPAAVTATRLTTAARAEHWDHVLGDGVATRDVLALRLAPEQIDAVARRALADAELAGDPAPEPATLLAAARRLSTSTVSRTSTGSGASLDDLVLPPRTRREVERLVAWVRDRDDVLALGDLHGKGGKGTGITALFSGSPGTGKTLAAHVVADSLGADLYEVDLAAVVDKYIGETEKNLERVFAHAESLGAVLFFDEADALFGARSAVTDARDRYANQEVSYLLQRMEASEAVTILATNLRGNLDPAFARRLHFTVHFPDPDETTRAHLWKHHLAQLPTTDPADPVDVELLARALELAGGDIRNIVLAAAYDAVAEHRPVGMRDVRLAATREAAKLGRRISHPDWPTHP